MGTEINLTVGGLMVDWAKNNRGADHRSLFQEGDRTWIQETHDDAPAEYGYEALIRPLSRVLSRLNLMGITIDTARKEYEQLIFDQADIFSESDEHPQKTLSFDEYCDFINRYPIEELSEQYEEFYTDNSLLIPCRFIEVEDEINRLPYSDDILYWSERSYFGAKIRVLSTYSMLQVFGINEKNLCANVEWGYGPLVQAGWVAENEFLPGAIRSKTILVATEGTTDSRILKNAFSALRPDIADFFRFVDVDERHPFWGTGNLVKFAEGLVRIDIQNKVLFVLDNDAEGVDAMQRLQELKMPENMRAILLPDDETLRNFPAIGPEGTRNSDINGRAAAIECYLDLRLPNRPPAVVRWSNYKKEVNAWQGALEHKETYMRHFLNQTPEALQGESYDTSRLERILDAMTTEAMSLQNHLVE